MGGVYTCPLCTLLPRMHGLLCTGDEEGCRGGGRVTRAPLAARTHMVFHSMSTVNVTAMVWAYHMHELLTQVGLHLRTPCLYIALCPS